MRTYGRFAAVVVVSATMVAPPPALLFASVRANAARAPKVSTSPVLLPPVIEAVLPGWVIPTLGPVGGQWSEGRSGDGLTQVLVQPGAGERGPSTASTKFAVVKLSATGKPVGAPRIVEVQGKFGYDAVNNAGTRLFVTENRDVEAPGTYRVRMIDLVSGTLDPRIMSDRAIDSESYATSGEPAELMYGSAIKRVRPTTPNRWIFTLYDADGKHPFVHALNTGGFALCLDLPKHGRNYTDLALSWDLRTVGDKLMVKNSTLGKSWRYVFDNSRVRVA
jgi:hypothetical protein